MIRILLAILACLTPLTSFALSPERWVVYYNDTLPSEAFEPYRVIVFDGNQHPPLRPLQHRGKLLLGYLSLGEAEEYRPQFKQIKEKRLLLKKAPNWAGHHIVDIRKPDWAAMLIEDWIPSILHQGFNGIMLDTTDSVTYLETRDPKQFAGMKQAAINAIRAIRQHYPHIPIMVNRGFDILPEIAPHVDMIMAESIHVEHLPNTDKFKLFPKTEYTEMVNALKQAQTLNPNLKVYTLDYWPQKDTQGVRNIYEAQRSQGFVPYVSTMDLQHIYPEPDLSAPQ